MGESERLEEDDDDDRSRDGGSSGENDDDGSPKGSTWDRQSPKTPGKGSASLSGVAAVRQSGSKDPATANRQGRIWTCVSLSWPTG